LIRRGVDNNAVPMDIVVLRPVKQARSQLGHPTADNDSACQRHNPQ
jgi:hypothetical protein